MSNINLQDLVDRAGNMALNNIWGENSYQINMDILKLDPNNCAAYTRLAKYYKLDDNIEEARNMYLRVLEINPNNRGAINNLNEMEKEQRENDDVSQMKSIGDLVKAGKTSILKGKYKMAVKLFERAFGLEPSLKHAISLAGAYEKAGRHDRIEIIYHQLINDHSQQNDIEAIENEFKALHLNVKLGKKG